MIGSRTIKKLIPNSWRRAYRDYRTGLVVHHVSGPKTVRLNADEAAVTCLVKNGGFYIQAFVEHYIGMGFRHIVFLDNGSTDETVEIARRYSNVSIYTTELDVSRFQAVLKRVLAQTTVENGWCLDVDIDEFFDYPGSDVLALGHFLKYLNQRNFSAVLTQMLDMFSDRPLSHLLESDKEDLCATYRYYDLSAVGKTDYGRAELVAKFGDNNEEPGVRLKFCVGGVRKTLYGLDCLLTKHSLFRTDKGLTLFSHVHFVNGAKLADVSCVLLHYKLTSNAHQIALQNRDAFETTSQGYRDFMEVIEKHPEYQIKQSHAQELRGINELLTNDFLQASERYLEYVLKTDHGE